MRVDGGGSQPKAPTKELGFKKLDVNGDGKLSAEEMKDSKKFQGYDKNKDGEVTRDEAIVGAKAKAAEDRVKKALAKYDTNKDGKISGNEADDVKAFDKDHDGKVSADEAKAGMKAYDTDKDGKVTADEFRAGRRADRKQALDDKFEKAFAKLDGNEDGHLSGTELKKYGKWDKDGDGEVSKQEFLDGKHEAHKKAQADKQDKAWTEKLEKRFEKWDKTEDGWLSGNEVGDYRKQFDKDGDGEVTKKEFIEGKKELHKLKEEAKLLGDDPSQVRLDTPKPAPNNAV